MEFGKNIVIEQGKTPEELCRRYGVSLPEAVWKARKNHTTLERAIISIAAKKREEYLKKYSHTITQGDFEY